MPHDPFYNSAPWKALRLKVLRRDRYICADCDVVCLGAKKNLPAPIVDHIESRRKRPDLAMDINNLVTLCIPCHNKKTYRADVPSKKFIQIGPDGFPVDESAVKESINERRH